MSNYYCINEKTTTMIKSIRLWDITKAQPTTGYNNKKTMMMATITRCKIKRVMQVALSYNNEKTTMTMTKIIRRRGGWGWWCSWAMASHNNTKKTTTINMSYNKKNTNMSINMTRKSGNQWWWHSKYQQAI
jgi:hypothetical protein